MDDTAVGEVGVISGTGGRFFDGQEKVIVVESIDE